MPKDPNCDTPTAVQKSITEHGGTNQYGQPYWRVILSNNHCRAKSGCWVDVPGGFEQFSLGSHIPGKGFELRHNELHVNSVVEEVRETPVWPIPNQWIVERWFPAEVWAPQGRDSWPEGSAYPEQGEYYLILYGPKEAPWLEMPELNDIKQAISMWERDYLNRPRDFNMAYAMLVEEDRLREEAEEKKMREELEYYYKHELLSIFNSTSLEAQRLRNSAAEAAGVTEHIGAGQ